MYWEAVNHDGHIAPNDRSVWMRPPSVAEAVEQRELRSRCIRYETLSYLTP